MSDDTHLSPDRHRRDNHAPTRDELTPPELYRVIENQSAQLAAAAEEITTLRAALTAVPQGLNWEAIHTANDALDGDPRDVLERWCAGAKHPCYCNWTRAEPSPRGELEAAIDAAITFVMSPEGDAMPAGDAFTGEVVRVAIEAWIAASPSPALDVGLRAAERRFYDWHTMEISKYREKWGWTDDFIDEEADRVKRDLLATLAPIEGEETSNG